MERVGIISRIVLMLMCLLLALTAANIGFNEWQRAHWQRSSLPHATHIAQTASIIDTVLRARPLDVPDVLRAVSAEVMRAVIVPTAPAPGDLLPAPNVAKKVRSLMQMPAPEIVAYTDGAGAAPGYAADNLEGVIRRAIVQLAPRRLLVVDVVVGPPHNSFEILGLPSGFWIGFLGCLVAALAFFAALRELEPLRRLREAVTRFDGRTTYAIGTDNDRSEIGRLIHAVGEMQARVATLLRERSFLIGAISHDAKTYLTRLRLRSEEIDDDARRAALIRDIDAMADLIETSLAYARGTTTAEHRGPVDLADLVAADIAERDALGATHAFDVALAESAIVEGDRVALKRVVANLIDNATKFGKSRIGITIAVIREDCRLSVGDDGPGIPTADRELVFSPFYRVEKSRSRLTGGTGLGLAIARQIVQAHGGDIDIRDAPLGGALFVVTLPLLRAAGRTNEVRAALAAPENARFKLPV